MAIQTNQQTDADQYKQQSSGVDDLGLSDKESNRSWKAL
jgi:hypothetical protein